MSGSHVFVTRGDLTHLRCDAWLLPGDSLYTVEDGWTTAVDGLAAAVQGLRGVTPDFAEGRALAVPVAGWDPERPLPVLTAVPLWGVQEPRDVRAPVEEFIKVAAASVSAWPPGRRSVPLLALPAFGTGEGGGGARRGAVLRELLAAAQAAGAAAGVDVVLVLRQESDLALAQSQRRQQPAEAVWPALSGRLRQAAKSLGAQAAQGQLVPFLGSGVSATAGAPTWPQLIHQLADRLDLDDQQRAQLSELDVLDQAHVVRELSGEQDIDFGTMVAEQVMVERYGLAPALLASLPVNQAVTLNYDRLFEIASEDVGRPVTVLPEASAAAGERWLLKLHGTVTDPGSIVLTRDDYLGYGANRGALSAIVKALLFTHRLLFVGFGLADDHVHAIVHDVRRAMPATANDRTFGTALLLREEPLQERIWRGKVEVLSMEEGRAEDRADGDEARTLEIFLDCLLAHAVNSQTFLLAQGYADVLSPAEGQLRERLLHLTANVSAEERDTSSWAVIATALRDLGLPVGD